MWCSKLLIVAIFFIARSQVTAQCCCSPCPCCEAGSTASASSPVVDIDDPETRSLLSKAMAPMDTITADERTFLWPTVNNQPKDTATPDARSFMWPTGNNQPFGIGNPWLGSGQGSPGASQGGISSGPSIQAQYPQQNVGPITQPQVGGWWPYPQWPTYPSWPPYPPGPSYPPGPPAPPTSPPPPPPPPGAGGGAAGAIAYPGMTSMNDFSSGHGAQVTIGGGGGK